MTSLIDQLKTCFRTSVPSVAIATPDGVATQRQISELFAQKRPLLTWDVVTGILGVNEKGRAAAQKIGADPALTANPVEALTLARKLPEGSVLFMRNPHLFLDQPYLIQAISNVRDVFKANERMLILLGQSFTLPPEIARDIILLDEPLPTRAQIARVVEEQFKNASLPLPPPEIIEQCARILLGCSLFEAEQLSALSLTPTGMDQSMLFARKRQLIAQTPGLSLADRPPTRAEVGGCTQFLDRGERIVNGEANVGALLFMDEAEKMFGGAQTDSSGVSQDQHGYYLSWHQDNNCIGVILVGESGAGKTYSALALATLKKTGLLPFLRMDLGAMKSSLVGSSEARFRSALKVARALTDGTILTVMTCNDLDALSPELKSRMTVGTYFFDQPRREERAAIWPIYLTKYGHKPESLTDDLLDRPWTGREIRACCEQAWNERISLTDAAENIVPVSITNAERMIKLREMAHNTFLSASYPGVFRKDRESDAVLSGGRKIDPSKDKWGIN